MTSTSTKRHLVAADLTAPKGHCRWCKQRVPKGKRTWCSQACIDEYLVRADPAHARRMVLARDQGLCASCGLDCTALEEAIRTAVEARRKAPWPLSRWPAPEVAEVLGALGFNVREAARAGHHLWEADHVLPVVEGGGACGLDGLRTLCLPCHRGESAALAARRARTPRPPRPVDRRQLNLFGDMAPPCEETAS